MSNFLHFYLMTQIFSNTKCQRNLCLIDLNLQVFCEPMSHHFQQNPMGPYFGKTLYGGVWRETNIFLIVPGTTHKMFGNLKDNFLSQDTVS